MAKAGRKSSTWLELLVRRFREGKARSRGLSKDGTVVEIPADFWGGLPVVDCNEGSARSRFLSPDLCFYRIEVLCEEASLPAAAAAGATENKVGARDATRTASPEIRNTDPRPSRRRSAYQGSQRIRARVVLKRLFSGEYPTEAEVSTPDLWIRFCAEYDRVEGKAKPPSKLGCPSIETLLREVGRKDD